MSISIRFWHLKNKDWIEIKNQEIAEEEILKNWLEKNISVISDELLVIGSEVRTDFGDFIDLLCLDRDGNKVILELKKGKAPRDAIAQIIDYGAWVWLLGAEEIKEKAREYFKSDREDILEKKFREKFNNDLPDLDEGDVKLILVASEIDPKTEQIIEFLRYYGDIDIDYALCKLYENEKKEKFVISAQKIEFASPKEKAEKRKRKNITYNELYLAFKKLGLSDLFEKLYERLSEQAYPYFGVKSVSFKDSNYHTILGVDPFGSSKEKGIYCWLYTKRFHSFYHIKIHEHKIENELKDMIAQKFDGGENSGFYFYIKDRNQLNKFLKLIEK